MWLLLLASLPVAHSATTDDPFDKRVWERSSASIPLTAGGWVNAGVVTDVRSVISGNSIPIGPSISAVGYFDVYSARIALDGSDVWVGLDHRNKASRDTNWWAAGLRVGRWADEARIGVGITASTLGSSRAGGGGARASGWVTDSETVIVLPFDGLNILDTYLGWTMNIGYRVPVADAFVAPNFRLGVALAGLGQTQDFAITAGLGVRVALNRNLRGS